MQILIRNSHRSEFRDEYRDEYKLIPLFKEQIVNIFQEEVYSDPFIELLNRTLGKDEYYARFSGEKYPIGTIDKLNLEKVSKNKCLVHRCDLDIKRLFEDEIINKIFSFRELLQRYVTFTNDRKTDGDNYITICYALCWNHDCNRIECNISMNISSMTYMIKLMIENGISDKLIEEFISNYRRY